MGEKTAGVGHFQIPTAPAALTAVAQSASANTLGSAVSFGNAPSTMFITGVAIGAATTQTPTYVQIQILVAASIVGSVLVPYGVSSAAASSVATGYRAIYPPIPVASGAAITVKSASSVASAVNWGVSLECIAQSNVVDDGIAQTSNVTQWNGTTVSTPATAGIPDVNVKNINNVVAATPGAAGGLFIAGTNAATTITTGLTTTFTGNLTGSVGSVTGLTASNLDATISSRMATYTQPTGFLAATFPATVASTTNISAGTITTVTNLTNAPTAGDFTATMKTSIGTAVAASAVASVTGNVGGNVTGSVGSVVGAVGSVTGLTASDVGAIKAKTDSLTFTVAGFIDANTLKIKGTTITGSGTAGSPWGP